MNLLIGSVAEDGRLAYLEDGKILWETPMNCPKYIETDGEFYYTYSQGDPLVLHSYKKVGKAFELVSTLPIKEKTLSHLCFSKKHNLLFCSSMDSGYMHAVKVSDGVFEEVAFAEIPGGALPSRCHQVVFNKAEDLAIVINYAQNKVFFHKVENGVFVDEVMWQFDDILTRHVMYSHDEEILYMVTEKSNEIMVLDYKNMQILQRQPINPTYFLAGAQGATFAKDDETKKLYVHIRGYNTISEFNMGADHALSYVSSFDIGGENSRHMFLSADKTTLVCACINTNNVSFVDVKTKKVTCSIPFDGAVSAIEVK